METFFESKHKLSCSGPILVQKMGKCNTRGRIFLKMPKTCSSALLKDKSFLADSISHYLSITLLTCLFACLLACLIISVYLSACLPTCLSDYKYLPVCLSACLHLLTCVSVCPLEFVFLPISVDFCGFLSS